MPWCDTCDHYLAPNSVSGDGTCPDCGQKVDGADAVAETAKSDKVPWHFWLMVVSLVAYLGYRLVQGVVWAAHHF